MARRLPFGRSLIAALAAVMALGVGAASRAAPPPSRLAQEVSRVEAVRAVKRLQTAYAQYRQFGLWSEMAALFTADGEASFGGDSAKGAALAGHFRKALGGGQDGLPAGGLNTELDFTPLVVLAPDGRTARARWRVIILKGQFGGAAEWAGGIQESDYVDDRGVWKIANLRYVPEFAGPYETGWRNLETDAKILPYWFTPDQAGTPVPPLPAATGAAASPASLPALDRRAQALNDEDKVRNLQNAYGYYVDGRMWDDVADLFTADGVLSAADLGVYQGPKSIRRGLERDGPPGLAAGELNDRLQLDTTVTIAPNGREARARGVELGMLGATATGKAYWALSVFENRYVKQGGVWRIREMRLFPTMKADYDLGWGKSRVTDPAPPAAFAPDRPAPAADSMREGVAIPAFSERHPVTGKPVAYPRAARIAGLTALVRPYAGPAEPAPPRSAAPAVEVRRKLAVSIGYDAVENLNTAFGEYLTDQQGDFLGKLFAVKGMRQRPFSGFHIGYAHIRAAAEAAWGPPRTPRTLLRIHLRTQPVIDVADDGRSAKLRSRLLLFPSDRNAAGAVYGGMYQDQAALEGGVWRFWNVAIDDQLFLTASYKEGWARLKPPAPPPPAGAAPRAEGGGGRIPPVPPDIPISNIVPREVGMRGGPGEPIEWPQQKPMWFHYKNPVSGRTPPNYWPDCVPCTVRPDVSLKANGY